MRFDESLHKLVEVIKTIDSIREDYTCARPAITLNAITSYHYDVLSRLLGILLSVQVLMKEKHYYTSVSTCRMLTDLLIRLAVISYSDSKLDFESLFSKNDCLDTYKRYGNWLVSEDWKTLHKTNINEGNVIEHLKNSFEVDISGLHSYFCKYEHFTSVAINHVKRNIQHEYFALGNNAEDLEWSELINKIDICSKYIVKIIKLQDRVYANLNIITEEDCAIYFGWKDSFYVRELIFSATEISYKLFHFKEVADKKIKQQTYFKEHKLSPSYIDINNNIVCYDENSELVSVNIENDTLVKHHCKLVHLPYKLVDRTNEEVHILLEEYKKWCHNKGVAI